MTAVSVSIRSSCPISVPSYSVITKFNVVQAETVLIASNDAISVGENALINVNVPIDATGNVSITLNNIVYASKINNGSAVIEITNLSAGKYENVLVVYSGDKNYKGTNTATDIQVSKIYVSWNSEISDTALNVDDNTRISISGTVPKNISG